MRLQVAGAIIENGEGLVLLAERPPGKHIESLWEFPGGKIEAGESAEEALRRELQEELHLDVQIEKYLGGFSYIYPGKPVELHVFQVRALNEPRTSADVRRFRWVKPREISHSVLAPADIAPLEAYLALGPMHEKG
jgi:8-oxo-dGTP diphosphatase